MRINRTELIDKLRKRVEELTAAADDKYAREGAEEEARREAYREKTKVEWMKLAERIRRRCTEGQAVLSEDVPDTLRQDGYLGYRPRKVTRQPPATAELRRLIGLLEASPDETVSLVSLERAGFNLGRVLK